ncbi:hypothetical protein ACH4LN_31265 [Streptomyces albus]|uniref:hypothetical protein n=1 Tax=Streptomyces TaxID=1883 RepID=UPI00131D1898|nr:MULTISPECIES: hypothetical protein [Streptomyces]GHJ19778.1 hypothetical protein TPA0909_13920 [Streptomyces albus]
MSNKTSFEQEWETAKAAHHAGETTRMQLAHATTPGEKPTKKKDELTVTPMTKASVAKYLQETFKPEVSSSGKIAAVASETLCGGNDHGSAHAAGPQGELTRWSTGQGLRYSLRQWNRQVKNLQDLLSGTIKALGYTSSSFAGLEKDTEAGFNTSQSSIPCWT